jgi:hypothetical protein
MLDEASMIVLPRHGYEVEELKSSRFAGAVLMFHVEPIVMAGMGIRLCHDS